MTSEKHTNQPSAEHEDNVILELPQPGSLIYTRPRGTDWDRVPWPVTPDVHTRPEWKLLLTANDLLAGRPARDDNVPQVRSWMAWLREEGLVLDYVKDEGFRYVRARPGRDTGLVRRRDPEPGPCRRVIGLVTGNGGCLTHGLWYGVPAPTPEGCELIPGVVCKLCHRVAHRQIKPIAGQVKELSAYCLRCLDALRHLPAWATATSHRPMWKYDSTFTWASGGLPLASMAASFDGERDTLGWAPFYIDVWEDGAVTYTNVTLDREPEDGVLWQEWTRDFPPSATVSAQVAIDAVTSQLPPGLRDVALEVDVEHVADLVREHTRLA